MAYSLLFNESFKDKITEKEWLMKRILVLVGMAIFSGWLMIPGSAAAYDINDLSKLRNTNTCTNCNLTGAPLTGAILSKADMTGSNLTSATLTAAKLDSAKLINANLGGAHLDNADLTGADLSDANLTGANLDGATWIDGKTCGRGSTGVCRK